MGRNFYYKVLEEATDTIEELDERLAYLTDVQLISESKKKEEIEYLFKHALAQQLTYDSMMQQSRIDSHNKIARSIEKVFANNINEYYSTLAYHYEKAENKEKTEEYLIKAGDEAIRTGASSEALNFYEEALELVPESRRLDKSDIQIRDLEIKIANLYRVTGKNLEAAERYRQLISKYTNHYFMKSEMFTKYRGILNLMVFFFMVNNRRLFFGKKVYEGFEIFMKLTYGFGMSLISMNSRQFALETSPIMTRVCRYDFRNSPEALRLYSTSSALFSMTGLSFTTSRKMINFVEDTGIRNDPNGYISFMMIKRMHHYYTGNWDIQEDQNTVVNQGLRVGNFWDTVTYIMYSGLVHVESGECKKFLELKDKLLYLADTFDDSYSGSQGYRLAALGFYKFRMFDKFNAIAKEGAKYIGNTENSALLVVYHSIESLIHLNLGDLKNADKAIIIAEQWKDKISNVPVYHTQYLLARLKLDLEKFKSLIKSDQHFRQTLKEIKSNSNKLIAQSKKLIANLTEAYLLKAKLYQLLTKNQKVLKYLQLAIQTGEKYNGRLELSRAYFETGKFLSDPKTKQQQLNGLTGKDYLEKARTMFEEMDLQWDLEEYRKFVQQS